MNKVGRVVGVLAALAIPRLALAQEGARVSPEGRAGRSAEYLEYLSAGDITVWGLNFRVSKPHGESIENSGISWEEAFGVGLGAGMDFAYLAEASDRFHVGIYFSGSFDIYGGKEVTETDQNGPFAFKAEELWIARGVAGVAARQTFGKLFVEERIGGGFTFFSDADADFVNAFVLLEDAALVESSIEFAFEARVRGGIRVSPGAEMSLSFSYELSGPPKGADDPGDFNVDFERFENLVFTIGLGVRF